MWHPTGICHQQEMYGVYFSYQLQPQIRPAHRSRSAIKKLSYVDPLRFGMDYVSIISEPLYQYHHGETGEN